MWYVHHNKPPSGLTSIQLSIGSEFYAPKYAKGLGMSNETSAPNILSGMLTKKILYFNSSLNTVKHGRR